jgi:hypothetical protein
MDIHERKSPLLVERRPGMAMSFASPVAVSKFQVAVIQDLSDGYRPLVKNKYFTNAAAPETRTIMTSSPNGPMAHIIPPPII